MRQILVGIALAFALCLAAAGTARAQEVQVALDQAGRIEVVDARLAQQLRLFVDEYPGFQEARLFQIRPGEYVLEVTTLRDGRTARQRVPLGEEEVRELRARVTERQLAHAPRVGLNQEGRFLMLGSTTLLGLYPYGLLVPEALGLDGSAYFGTYMLTAGASFFLPWMLTQNEPVTYGMAALNRYGMTRGPIHGILLGALVADEPTWQGMATLMLLGGVAEGIGGYLWARNTDMTLGRANAIAWGGDLGLLAGAATAMLVLPEDTEPIRPVAGMLLGGSAAGIAAGNMIGQRRDFTYGDVEVASIPGALGAYSALAALDVMGVENRRIFGAGILAGTAAGLVVGDRLVRGKEFAFGEAIMIWLGSGAGWLTGLGVAALTETETSEAYLTLSALGAIAGYAGTYAVMAPAATRRAPQALSSSWSVEVSPQALVGMGAGQFMPVPDAPLPLVSVKYRF